MDQSRKWIYFIVFYCAFILKNSAFDNEFHQTVKAGFVQVMKKLESRGNFRTSQRETNSVWSGLTFEPFKKDIWFK